jgi:hypothetical protein
MNLAKLSELVSELAAGLDTVDGLAAARDALRRPFNDKINAIQKAEREAKRLAREGEAQRLCEALKPGEKVTMVEHGFLDIFSTNPGRGDVFFNKDATVHVYQPRKKILWLNVTGTKGHKEKFAQCRPFKLHDVAGYNVRRAVA